MPRGCIRRMKPRTVALWKAAMARRVVGVPADAPADAPEDAQADAPAHAPADTNLGPPAWLVLCQTAGAVPGEPGALPLPPAIKLPLTGACEAAAAGNADAGDPPAGPPMSVASALGAHSAAAAADAALAGLGAARALELLRESQQKEQTGGASAARVLTFGRAATCDVQLDSTLRPMMLSRAHARVSVDADPPYRVRVEDLGSSNGTAINGEALTPGEPRVLLEDDVICFGAWRGKNASDVRYRLSRASE